MQRITVSVTDEQAERLKSWQRIAGVPVSVQVRSALDEQKQRHSVGDQRSESERHKA